MIYSSSVFQSLSYQKQIYFERLGLNYSYRLIKNHTHDWIWLQSRWQDCVLEVALAVIGTKSKWGGVGVRSYG